MKEAHKRNMSLADAALMAMLDTEKRAGVLVQGNRKRMVIKTKHSLALPFRKLESTNNFQRV
jgi:hypothetical protein